MNPKIGEVWQGSDGVLRWIDGIDDRLWANETNTDVVAVDDIPEWFATAKRVFQPFSPQPQGETIEIAVIRSSNHDRHIYAAGQLGQTAAAHARSYGPDVHIQTIRATLLPREIPVVTGEVLPAVEMTP